MVSQRIQEGTSREKPVVISRIGTHTDKQKRYIWGTQRHVLPHVLVLGLPGISPPLFPLQPLRIILPHGWSHTPNLTISISRLHKKWRARLLLTASEWESSSSIAVACICVFWVFWEHGLQAGSVGDFCPSPLSSCCALILIISQMTSTFSIAAKTREWIWVIKFIQEEWRCCINPFLFSLRFDVLTS